MWRNAESGLTTYSLALLNNVSFNVVEFAKSQVITLMRDTQCFKGSPGNRLFSKAWCKQPLHDFVTVFSTESRVPSHDSCSTHHWKQVTFLQPFFPPSHPLPCLHPLPILTPYNLFLFCCFVLDFILIWSLIVQFCDFCFRKTICNRLILLSLLVFLKIFFNLVFHCPVWGFFL